MLCFLVQIGLNFQRLAFSQVSVRQVDLEAVDILKTFFDPGWRKPKETKAANHSLPKSLSSRQAEEIRGRLRKIEERLVSIYFDLVAPRKPSKSNNQMGLDAFGS